MMTLGIGLLVVLLSQGSSAASPAQSAIAPPEASLRGLKAVSVSLSIEGIRDIPERTYRSDLEDRLRAAGLEILTPDLGAASYPRLTLVVSAEMLRGANGNVIGSLGVYRLYLSQLVPRNGVTLSVTTWANHGYLVEGGLTFPGSLRKEYLAALTNFLDDFREVNKR